jgi:hypothetical protein
MRPHCQRWLTAERMEILGIGAEKYSSIDIYDWQRWLIELDLSSIISGLNIDLQDILDLDALIDLVWGRATKKSQVVDTVTVLPHWQSFDVISLRISRPD